jgi:hypothetical protein
MLVFYQAEESRRTTVHSISDSRHGLVIGSNTYLPDFTVVDPGGMLSLGVSPVHVMLNYKPLRWRISFFRTRQAATGPLHFDARKYYVGFQISNDPSFTASPSVWVIQHTIAVHGGATGGPTGGSDPGIGLRTAAGVLGLPSDPLAGPYYVRVGQQSVDDLLGQIGAEQHMTLLGFNITFDNL